MNIKVNDLKLEDIACHLQEKFYNEYGSTIGRYKLKFLVRRFLEYIEDEIAAGNTVTIQGHGHYSSYVTSEQTGNFFGRGDYHLDEQCIPTWRAGKTFKSKVRSAHIARKNAEHKAKKAAK